MMRWKWLPAMLVAALLWLAVTVWAQDGGNAGLDLGGEGSQASEGPVGIDRDDDEETGDELGEDIEEDGGMDFEQVADQDESEIEGPEETGESLESDGTGAREGSLPGSRPKDIPDGVNNEEDESDADALTCRNAIGRDFSVECGVQAAFHAPRQDPQVLAGLCHPECIAAIKDNVAALESNCPSDNPAVISRPVDIVEIESACVKNGKNEYCGAEFHRILLELGLAGSIDVFAAMPEEYWCSECGEVMMKRLEGLERLSQDNGKGAERFRNVAQEKCPKGPKTVGLENTAEGMAGRGVAAWAAAAVVMTLTLLA